MSAEDCAWMKAALEVARAAAAMGEVPVGAVLVSQGRLVASAHNRTITDGDPTAHAEVLALRAAASACGNHRIGGVLYVTLEPCVMCMGAAVQARIDRLVFAATDSKAGAACSLYRLGEDSRLNHRFAVQGGVLADDCSRVLTEFFRQRREDH